MATTAGRPAPLLERDELLVRIRGALAGAREGRGALVVLEGPPGIGKTGVLAAARAAAAGEGMRVLGARGAELEREFAFGVVRQLLEPAIAETAAAERADLLQGPAGRAAALLDLDATGSDPDAGARRPPDPSFSVLHGLYWLCAGLAASRPALLVVDDADCADAASLRFLTFLAPRLEELSMTVVVTTRPVAPGAGDDLVESLTLDPAARFLRVPPLTEAAVARLVEERLGVAADPDFVAACVRRTGGNPLLVRELIAQLRDGRVAPERAAAARVDDLDTRTVGRWALVQLTRLPPEAAALARAVAILETASVAEAAALAGLDPDVARRAADVLVAAEVLAPDRPLAFAHPIVRAGVYAELSGAERTGGHRRAAEVLAADASQRGRMAEHLLATDPAGDAWVVERLVEAARAAAAQGAPESAATHLRRALREPPPRRSVPGLLLDLGVAEHRAGLPRADEHLAAAVQAAGPGPVRVQVALVRAHALALAQRSAEAVEAIADAVTGLGPGDDEIALQAEIALVAIAAIDAATAPALAARIRALRARAATDAAPSRDLLGVAAIVAVQANEPAAVAADLARRALAAGLRPVPEPTDLPWYTTATITLVWAECHDEAEAALDAGVAEARATGDGALFSAALAYRAWATLQSGDLLGAEADARMALETPGLPAPPLWRMLAGGLLVETLVDQGRGDEADRVATAFGPEAEGGTQTAAVLRHARGRARIGRGDVAGRDDLLAARAVMDATGAVGPNCLPSRGAAAVALLAAGDREHAARLADDDLRRARAFGAPRALGAALRVAGVVAGDAAGEALLREAVAVLDEAGAPLDLAGARADLGAALRRTGRGAEARDLLRAAMDAAHHAGARPLAEVAEADLRATGAKPRRVVLTGLEALTAGERRVAQLAAEGLTNREIAQELFVTARTVEGHLTRVFKKLDVRSRGGLATALREPARDAPPPARPAR